MQESEHTAITLLTAPCVAWCLAHWDGNVAHSGSQCRPQCLCLETPCTQIQNTLIIFCITHQSTISHKMKIIWYFVSACKLKTLCSETTYRIINKIYIGNVNETYFCSQSVKLHIKGGQTKKESYVWAAVHAVLILVLGNVGLLGLTPSLRDNGGDPITFRVTDLVSLDLYMQKRILYCNYKMKLLFHRFPHNNDKLKVHKHNTVLTKFEV